MIHTKLLIRRLAYVPWLLAFGLVLGWAGEAQAQQIRLTVDKDSIREDGGAATITVTATNYTTTTYDTKALVGTVDPQDKEKYVIVTVSDDDNGLNNRYRVVSTTIMIPHDKDAATGTITITPIEDDAVSSPSNLPIQLNGQAGSNLTVENNGSTAQITLIDKDQLSSGITLSFAPKEVSEEAGRTKITVTATLNGETVKDPLTFDLSVVGADAFTPARETDTQAGRDSHYDLDPLGKLTIPKRKVKGSTDIYIDPKEEGWVAIGARSDTDLRYDGNGTEDDGPEGEGDDEQVIEVEANFFTITAVDLTKIKDDGLTADITSIREDDGSVEIELTVTLAADALADTPVKFSIVDDAAADAPEDFNDGGALRDENYTARFGELTIEKDATSGTAMLYLTAIDDDGTNSARIIRVKAVAGSSDAQYEDITITDDDTFTENITLKAVPAELEEDAEGDEEGYVDVMITATLDGAVFDDKVTLKLVLDGGSAIRDQDYTAIIRSLTIDADEVSGSTMISINPVDDGAVDADETIFVKSITELKNDDEDAINVGTVTGSADDDDLVDNRAKITLKDTGEKAASEDPDDSTPAFSDEDVLASDTAIEGTVGVELEEAVELPEAEGDGDLTYSVSANLPDGLDFDAETRMISGTPTTAGDTKIVYTVIDGDEGEQLPAESAALTYLIEIVEAPEPTADVESVELSQSSVRESADATEIMVTAVLAEPAEKEETVTFVIGEGDPAAKRDVDYNVTLSSAQVTVEVGGTKAATTLTLTPIDNEDDDGDRALSVTATAVKGEPGSEDITIADDETPSASITLSAAPHTVKEDAGTVAVLITATLNGQVLEEDAEVIIAIDDASSTAKREADYIASFSARLSIAKGDVSGSTALALSPIADGKDEDDEAFTLVGTIADLTVSPATITLEDTEAAPDPDPEEEDGEDPEDTTPEDTTPEDTTPAFSEEAVAASSTAIKGTVGVALTAVELPGATGDGNLTYSVSANLPAGLSFTPSDVDESMDESMAEDADESMAEDADESMAEESTPTSGGTISGTPTAAGSTTIIYVVIDGDETNPESAALTYTIEIAAPPPPMIDVASVTSTHESVRESGETTAITLTATLAEASTIEEKVLFTIVGPSDGAAAVRDVDYTATLGGLVTIAAGETQGSTTLTLTPIDNSEADGNKFLAVQATVAAKSGASARTDDIKIADDETASASIALSVNPHTISEGADNTVGTITATLDGKALDADATVSIAIDVASAATRDVDYRMLFTTPLTISAGQISGSVAFAIDPISDDADEGNETITVTGTIDDLAGGSATITLEDYEMTDETTTMMDPLAFAEGMMIGDVGVTSGSPMSAVVLPEASGGEGDISYSVSELPAGLSFDAATRTLSGAAEAEGTTEVTYTATAGDESVPLTFSIMVNPPLSFGDLFGLFNNGAGKANPAQESVDGVIPIVVGQAYSLTLPAVEGGTPPYSYSLSGLPAGLSFDPATRTVSGTATEVSEAVAVIYTVTDGSGASSSLPFLVAVVEPPLDAPDALVAEDYKGADGAGDQGGFVLLTWDLSEHHDSIDGYRIFRELPVLGNEMVPWAMVDAVPGVNIGRAIVATLDNVATNWGIAAERGGQTTHGAAKAVFVSGNQAYELMAETMMVSREAAQAGDAPVFASLLPEALAYAQGVAPKLNLVAGVLSSAITLTEEPVRATDDIAPLAVPLLSVLDAPNDAGSRILLTWTLSLSDQLLQGVVTGAIGPTAVESVVGVHGYGIYRRAMGEDEFVSVAQVDAGVTSFVDETALNGVRYTYQVRPYDLDNETGSDLEQTAMAVRNSVLDSEGRALFGLFGVDNRIGFDDFFIFADNFGLTAEDAGFDPAFDLAPNATIDFDDFFVFADNFGRSTAGAGKRVPMLAGLNADARMYLDARTAMPIVGEDFVLDVRVADFAAIKGYGLQVQYEADKLEFVEVLTEQPLGGSELATPQVLADQAGVLTVAAYGDLVSDGEVPLSLVFRAITEIENTVVEITDNQTYDSEFGFNRLALPAPVQLQTRPEVFALANNYPNPFNPATTIKYALPQAADVELTVYNVVGQPVRTLVAEHQSAGRYVVEWDATNDSGHSLSSGMYFYRLEAAGGEFLEVKKMLLLK